MVFGCSTLVASVRGGVGHANPLCIQDFTLNRVETFKTYVAHPQLTANEVASLYFNLAGESPDAIAALTDLLPDDASQIVEADLAKAPTDEAGWRDFMVVIPESDPVELTRRFRLGVEAVREFRRTTPHAR